MTKIENWINEHVQLRAGQYKDLTEQMERQCGADIAGSYRDWDPTQVGDWYERILFSYLLEGFDDQSKVLDIGFGDGWPSLLIAPEVGEVVGIDIAHQRVRKAQENQARRGIENAQFMQMSSEEMEFADATFDGAFSFSCIEQTDSFATVQEIYRVLKPGGMLVGSLQDLSQFPPGEYINRLSPRAASKSTQGNCILHYSISDLTNLTEVNYVLEISDALDQKIHEEIAPGWAHLSAEQSADLERLLREFANDVLAGFTYTTQHLSISKVKEYLRAAGFREVSIFHFSNISQMIKVVQGWQAEGLLPALGEHFGVLARGFKDLLDVQSGVNPQIRHIHVKAIK